MFFASGPVQQAPDLAVSPSFWGMNWMGNTNPNDPPAGTWPMLQFDGVRSFINIDLIALSAGVFDWTQFDARHSYFPLQVGWPFPIVLTFDRFPSFWNGGQADNIPPSDFAPFQQFVALCCARLIALGYPASEIYIESWNEINRVNTFNGTTTQKVQTAAAAYAGAKSVNSAIHVGSPSFTTATGGNDYAVFLAAGGDVYCELTFMHGYLASGATNVPENMIAEIATYTTAISGYPRLALAPVWMVEGGWGAGNWLTDAKKGPFVPRYFIYLKYYGVSKAFWYAYNSPAVGFGQLKDYDLDALTASGVAWRETRAWLNGAVLSNPTTVGTVWTWTLTRPGYLGLIVYDTATNSSYTPPSNGYTRYRDLAGNVTVYASGAVTLPVSGGAIIFETGAP